MIGDRDDAFRRIKSLLPRWFGSGDTPVLDALLQGYAWAISFAWGLYDYARLQTRILTATDGWLDLIAGDFFGTGLTRKEGQGDASYRAAILSNLIRDRVTREGVRKVLLSLTGREPIIIEPWRPADCGGYGVPMMGYGVGGHYGARDMPAQSFVTAFRPVSTGAPYISGYSCPQSAYNTPSRFVYVSEAEVGAAIGDTDIFATIRAVKAAGTLIWTRIRS